MNIEYDVKKVPASHIFKIAEESLNEGKSIKITVVGNSMYPFLRNKIDSVELYREEYINIKINDIVVARKGTKYILHRVYKKNNDSFVMLGDGNFTTDGIYSKDDLICKASAIYRKDKRISCSSFSFKLLSILWKMLRPFRKYIFKAYYKIRCYKVKNK